MAPVPNGDNDDKFWVEHPDSAPFRHSSEDAQAGLNSFEKLLVETLSCRDPSMRWFLAMHEGLFPFIRASCPARGIIVHRGSSQSGKTSGAQRFTFLHGLGEVKGDYSVAALGDVGDIGLLVMDNREQCNMPQPFLDHCLFLATGAERGRSNAEGKIRTARGRGRPAAVITSIEGVYKDEVQQRCISVEFEIKERMIGRREIEEQVIQQRDKIQSSLMQVLSRYLKIRLEQRHTPWPRPNLQEHFQALADLLRAFAEVAGKPAGWAEQLIADWDRQLTDAEPEEDELEDPITAVITGADSLWIECGNQECVYVTECSALYRALRQARTWDLQLPKTVAGLSHRLRSNKFRSFKFVTEEMRPDIAALKRSAYRRPIGFVFQRDAMTRDDGLTLGKAS